jgi:hypothetical protein
MPLWTTSRRRLLRSRPALALRRRGAVATGVAVGMLLHLGAAVLGVAAGVPGLWQVGFFWSEWWSLVPEPAQPWLFAAARGAAYGALAGWTVQHSRSQRLRLLPVGWDAALVTAGAELLVAIGDIQYGTQYRLIAAALGAAVGRLTTLVMRGSRS